MCSYNSDTAGNTSVFINVPVYFLFSVTAELVCDPPCAENKVCQNSSGDPECVCADGFTGEDVCTGILQF